MSILLFQVATVFCLQSQHTACVGRLVFTRVLLIVRAETRLRLKFEVDIVSENWIV
jgi:hypothetical protein